jgi:hypothetical protein
VTVVLQPPTMAASMAYATSDLWSNLMASIGEAPLVVTASSGARLDADMSVARPEPTVSSREWIEAHYGTLLRAFRHKTLVVVKDRILHALDGPVDPIAVNRLARELGLSGDWTFEYVTDDHLALM